MQLEIYKWWTLHCYCRIQDGELWIITPDICDIIHVCVHIFIYLEPK